MKLTTRIIERALGEYPSACVAVSGGSDSLVLAHVVYGVMRLSLPMLYTNTRMDYPETKAHIERLAAHFGAPRLIVAEAPREPCEQWQRYGWPMLGKLAARKWEQSHEGRDMGFRCDVSSCCRAMKIAPARKAMRDEGIALSLTGQRGGADDQLRALRALKDSPVYYVKADKVALCNPLTGWTDMMVRRCIAAHSMPQHPAKARGAVTIGCLFCGGGAQFTNSGFRVLRTTNPEAWRRFVVDWRAGEIITAIKRDVALAVAQQAIAAAGGLEWLADNKPWVFDFLRETPLAGYER